MKIAEKSVKAVLIALSIFFGGWFILPVLSGVICIGNIFGVLMCGFVFLRCVFSKWFKRLKYKCYENRIKKFLWRFCQAGIALFTIYAITVTCAMLYFSTIVPEEKSTLITLGAMVRKNGVPSGSLYARINASYDYLSQNKNAVDILSGGKGDNECMTEAQCMFDYLTAKGIDKDRLIMEEKSTNTESNIKNSYQIIEEKNLPKNIAIATDAYHQLRARIIASKLGIKGHIGAVNSKTPRSVIPTYYVREWFALPVELLK